ncbi:DUF4129 domain-containing protein [Beggiatoa leptomitoformis]|uniref:DUF4129 domain-containing protein n=1 Tax=Beggiatoa leptomitoformis TaxID=288004 RepID=A0A2N9YH14_9GAMM|nr:DUF4129 domain-containing protein [Beggiatoa leptomitoformis]ALG68190.1 hypothetical protein AL038_11325 [Beggiatoa leptomitoformis]AUI69506.1 hypothetical protein BLE401_12945 [Beggiatoa leptomitoformis]
MQVERVTTVIRLRNQWEAIDLGFSLVRQNALRFYPLWFAIFLPISLAVYGLVYWLLPSYLWVATLLIWWLKPLYDPFILYFFSRAVFGEYPTVWQALREIKSILKVRLVIYLLFLNRFSVYRALKLPVWQLEGLRGKEARKRGALLGGQKTSARATWLIFVCVHFEWIFYLAPFVLVSMLFPTSDSLVLKLFAFDDQSDSLWFFSLKFSSYLLAISIIEPLYVVAGFTLYLNRRTQLEAWDIELMFHRIASRLAHVTHLPVMLLLLVLGCVLFGAYPVVSYADGDTAVSVKIDVDKLHTKRVINEVFTAPEFQTVEEFYAWERTTKVVPPSGDTVDKYINFDLSISLSEIIRYLLWGCVGIALAVIVLSIVDWLKKQSFFENSRRKKRAVNLHTLHQPLVETIELPDDIADVAWQLWQQGKQHEAVSLLYRGTVRRLCQQYQLALYDSATEGECLRVVRQYAVSELTAYFLTLTRTWQTIAYAQEIPATSTVQTLCHEWQNFFNVEKMVKIQAIKPNTIHQ